MTEHRDKGDEVTAVPQDDETEQRTDAKEWKNCSLSEYESMAKSLVHFSSKTVNSNAQVTGIRLPSDAALNLPYVSARTLLANGVELALDYVEGGAAQAGKLKQMRAVIRNDESAEAASPEERACIIKAIAEAKKEPYGVGLDYVDSRLRQLLIPRNDSQDGYVAVTPFTAGAVSEYLFDGQRGLISAHNQEVKQENLKGIRQRRRLVQAQFGIGGANPQNVGALVRSMTRPLLAPAPSSGTSIKKALSIFYRGVRIPVSPRSPLWDPLQTYRAFLSSITEESSSISPSEQRAQEKTLISTIVETVLDLGREALACLEMHRDVLPLELAEGTIGSVELELVSRQVPGVIRGLIDPRLRQVDFSRTKEGREMDWPREAAEYIAGRIATAKTFVDGESVTLIPLDQVGGRSLISLIEEVL